jgi:hypothetical protein
MVTTYLEGVNDSEPGVATSILKHSMMKIKQGKFLALAHFKTKQNVLKSGL